MQDIKRLYKTGVLTDSQEIFCKEYVLSYNATKAYLAAYPSCKSYNGARASASKLLTIPNIRDRVAELRAELDERYKISVGFLIEKCLWVIESAQEGKEEVKMNREGDFVPTGNKTIDYRAINDAVKNISQITGLNSSNVQANVNGNQNMNVNITTAKSVAREIMGLADNEDDVDD